MAAGYGGTLVMGATCLAVGLLASALSRNQLSAAMLTFGVLSLFLLLGALDLFLHQPTLKALIQYLDLFAQMDDFARGLIDSRHLVLHGSIVGFCLFCATTALEAKR
jgi:ABC-2 type transport system permease protein